jgi:hypothetical protein
LSLQGGDLWADYPVGNGDNFTHLLAPSLREGAEPGAVDLGGAGGRIAVAIANRTLWVWMRPSDRAACFDPSTAHQRAVITLPAGGQLIVGANRLYVLTDTGLASAPIPASCEP